VDVGDPDLDFVAEGEVGGEDCLAVVVAAVPVVMAVGDERLGRGGGWELCCLGESFIC